MRNYESITLDDKYLLERRIRCQCLVEDQGKEYKANLHIKGSQVFDYSCSCAQGNSYLGICPHCKVLFDAYKEQESNHGRPVTTSQQARA